MFHNDVDGIPGVACSTGITCVADVACSTGITCVAGVACSTGIACVAGIACSTGIACVAGVTGVDVLFAESLVTSTCRLGCRIANLN